VMKVGNNGAITAMTINTSGNTEFRAGTVSLPAITTTGDTNTGIFFPAADTVGVATGGTEKVRVASAGQIGIGGANYGTSGQVLTSGGASAAPSWATVSATGQLIRAPQVLTSGTSYTTPAGCTAIYVEAVGGGGGGGGAVNGQQVGAGGGGGGGYAAKYFTVTASTSYTYAIGAGGTAGAATGTNGSAGGSTTFTVSGTTITGSAGSGGTGANNSSQSAIKAGGDGGTGSNGDLNLSGSVGIEGICALGNTPSTAWSKGGGGGASGFGNGGGRTLAYGDSVGSTGTLGGGGGGGNAIGNAARAGGVGGAGWIRIWEYS